MLKLYSTGVRRRERRGLVDCRGPERPTYGVLSMIDPLFGSI